MYRCLGRITEKAQLNDRLTAAGTISSSTHERQRQLVDGARNHEESPAIKLRRGT